MNAIENYLTESQTKTQLNLVDIPHSDLSF